MQLQSFSKFQEYRDHFLTPPRREGWAMWFSFGLKVQHIGISEYWKALLGYFHRFWFVCKMGIKLFLPFFCECVDVCPSFFGRLNLCNWFVSSSKTYSYHSSNTNWCFSTLSGHVLLVIFPWSSFSGLLIDEWASCFWDVWEREWEEREKILICGQMGLKLFLSCFCVWSGHVFNFL